MNELVVAEDVKDLTPNQHRALRSLLMKPSIAEAAQECDLGVSTIRRYLRDPTFSRAYREGRGLVLQETIASLQQAGVDAVGILRESMAPEVDDQNLRLRAARLVLDYTLKATELERRMREQDELEARLEEIEEALARRRT